MKGLVIKNTGSWYLVKTEDGRTIECKIKGNFRLKGIRSTNPIAVGDYVQIIINNEGTAFISEIEDRKNYIIRRASNLSKQSHILAANLDQCMLIVTINYPETSTIFIDRFLATAEAYRVPVKLIFNKIDRYNEDDTRYMDALINLYTYIGYPCFKVSALNNIGTDEVKKDLKGKVTLLSGNSGVGKSTLINAILPEQTLKTGEISDYHNKGMHTTTFSEMFPVDGGGYIIDTPGVGLVLQRAKDILAQCISTKVCCIFSNRFFVAQFIIGNDGTNAEATGIPNLTSRFKTDTAAFDTRHIFIG